jgi:hypothetical protein
MKCKIVECSWSGDCAIIEITKKEPIDKYHCTYFRHLKNKQIKNKDLPDVKS